VALVTAEGVTGELAAHVAAPVVRMRFTVAMKLKTMHELVPI
jgi:hypothetical protein